MTTKKLISLIVTLCALTSCAASPAPETELVKETSAFSETGTSASETPATTPVITEEITSETTAKQPSPPENPTAAEKRTVKFPWVEYGKDPSILYPDSPSEEYLFEIDEDDEFIVKTSKRIWNSHIKGGWYNGPTHPPEILKYAYDDNVYWFEGGKYLDRDTTVFTKKGIYAVKAFRGLLEKIYLQDEKIIAEYYSGNSHGYGYVYYIYDTEFETIEEKHIQVFLDPAWGMDGIGFFPANYDEVEAYRATLTPIPEEDIKTLEIPYDNFESYEKLEKFLTESGFFE